MSFLQPRSPVGYHSHRLVGSLFCLSGNEEPPILADVEPGVEEEALLTALGTVPLLTAMPRSERTLADVDFRAPCAIVIGGEGKGVRPTLAALASDFRIPTVGVESLNAAVACGVILYEARRQRT